MSERHRKPYDDVLGMIGWTPMVRLNRVTDGARTPVYGKCEFMNPGGSVKDRIGVAMVDAAERDGSLAAGGVIVEGTAGNTGLALALAASIRGYRCIFTMPDKMSQEKVQLLRAFGAEVVITPTAVPADHPEHYVIKARSIAAETPGAIVANQFYNQANPDAHYATTGPEVWEQTEGRVTHFVAGTGTGGTLSGAGRYLKERRPEVRVVGVDPEGSIIGEVFRTGTQPEGHPYKVEGIGNDKIPDTLHLDQVDEFRTVSDAAAFAMARRLTREEGLFVGGSSGINVRVAADLAREVDDPEACVVTVLCDWGEHYLSKLFDDEWMRSNGFLDRPRRNVGDLVATKGADAPELLSVTPQTRTRLALSVITSHGVSQLPVVQDGDCVGSVTEGDLMSRVLEDPGILELPVSELMGPPFPVVDAHSAADGVSGLLSRDNPAVLVRRGGEVWSILTRYDLVRSLTGVG